MIPEKLNYLKLYEERLEQTLLKHCTAQGGSLVKPRV